MHYLILLPSLAACLILSLIDLRKRRVPRLIVLLGYLSQGLVLFLVVWLGLSETSWSQLGIGLAASLVSGACQVLLCLCAPRAVGLGDATFSTLMSLGLGFFHGFEGVCLSWLVTGLLGCLALWLWTVGRTSHTNDPDNSDNSGSDHTSSDAKPASISPGTASVTDRAQPLTDSTRAANQARPSIAFVPVITLGNLLTYLVYLL